MSRANRRRRYRRRHRTGLAQTPRGTLAGSLYVEGRLVGRVWLTSMAVAPSSWVGALVGGDPSAERATVTP
jgi:hypothetical protein